MQLNGKIYFNGTVRLISASTELGRVEKDEAVFNVAFRSKLPSMVMKLNILIKKKEFCSKNCPLKSKLTQKCHTMTSFPKFGLVIILARDKDSYTFICKYCLYNARVH